jgi:hypothetical protein
MGRKNRRSNRGMKQRSKMRSGNNLTALRKELASLHQKLDDLTSKNVNENVTDDIEDRIDTVEADIKKLVAKEGRRKSRGRKSLGRKRGGADHSMVPTEFNSKAYYKKLLRSGQTNDVEKPITVMDISRKPPPTTESTVDPNIVECINLRDNENWGEFYNEYKYNERLLTGEEGGGDSPEPVDHNWVMKHYLISRNENPDDWNISGLRGPLKGVRLVAPPGVNRMATMGGVNAVPNVHFDAYEPTNKTVLENNKLYYKDENFNNMEHHTAENSEGYIFLNVWTLFRIEDDAESITNYNLSFGEASGHPYTPEERQVPPEHVIPVSQGGENEPFVYYLMPKKKSYARFYTNMNMKVGEAYVFDSRYTPHVSCKYPDPPPDSIRGSAELRFIISRKP